MAKKALITGITGQDDVLAQTHKKIEQPDMAAQLKNLLKNFTIHSCLPGTLHCFLFRACALIILS